MSAIEKNNIAFIRAAEQPVHTLLVGPALKSASGLFQRKLEVVRCEHEADVTIASEIIVSQAKERPYDCVMVDLREPLAGDAEHVLRLAAVGCFGHLVLLANQEIAHAFSDVPGVDAVLVTPFEPIEIIKAIVAAAPQHEEVSDEPTAEVGDSANYTTEPSTSPPLAPTDADFDGSTTSSHGHIQPRPMNEDAPKWWKVSEQANDLKSKLAPGVARLGDLDQGLWRRFVPLASFLYKKLAIVLLTALFLTFVAYGAMIIFFMTNNNWSMPFELSRGHVLVEKIERDLSSLNLRRNELRQDLTSATAELEIAERAQRDGQLQLQLTRSTLQQEIRSVTAERDELLNQITRLNKIATDFDKHGGTKSQAKELQSSFDKRLITRDDLDRGKLSILETMHRLAAVDGEVSSKRLLVQRDDTNLKFLAGLLQQIDRPELASVQPTNSEFATLATQVIETKAQIAAAKTSYASAKSRSDQLKLSYEVISANLHSLEKTPAARAMEAPVTVLFVPYDNVDNVQEGDPLYSCALTIVVCSQVGEVGPAIDGESASVHPLFGKPMRGVFVEASFEHGNSAKSELVHAVSGPLWF